MFYVVDSRTNKGQGPMNREKAMELCGKLNDELQSKMTPKEKKAKPRQRDQRPYTFGTKADFAAYGKAFTLTKE